MCYIASHYFDIKESNLSLYVWPVFVVVTYGHGGEVQGPVRIDFHGYRFGMFKESYNIQSVDVEEHSKCSNHTQEPENAVANEMIQL